jgi:hypothetical protein
MCDEATDSCTQVPNDGLCSNGLHCDGVEICNALSGCQSGAAPACGDAVACTVDACDEATDACTHTPDHGACSNGVHCDGAETCDALAGCQAAAPVGCDDGVACTADACDEAADACTHSADAELCDDGLWCNGAESCDLVAGCVAGPAVSCDDGVACTLDACNEASDTCDHAPDDAACGDGLGCNGIESCDTVSGCIAGAPPACDDGIACTLDACDEPGSCRHDPVHTLCDDGLFCDGQESCNPLAGCIAGTPVDCDDAIACSADLCDEAADQCVNVAQSAACDDGLYCNGSETCDLLQGCVAGAAVACDDAVACTLDSCDELADACAHAPNDAACDDGVYCNGAESCSPATGCQGGAPIACDDGVSCTLDTCDEAGDACSFVPVTDSDGDGVCNEIDRCPLIPDPGQADLDGDGVGDACDNCATVKNGAAQAGVNGVGQQTDSDSDGVGDACDNCQLFPNPPPTPLGFQTTTGKQLDDDADGFGNHCDADFNNDAAIVNTTDFTAFKMSFGGRRSKAECGTGGTQPCDIYDLDGFSMAIDTADLVRFKDLFGAKRGPKCAQCGPPFPDPNLPCAGDACP